MPEVAVEEPRLSYFFPDDAIHAALLKERLQPGEKKPPEGGFQIGFSQCAVCFDFQLISLILNGTSPRVCV